MNERVIALKVCAGYDGGRFSVEIYRQSGRKKVSREIVRKRCDVDIFQFPSRNTIKSPFIKRNDPIDGSSAIMVWRIEEREDSISSFISWF